MARDGWRVMVSCEKKLERLTRTLARTRAGRDQWKERAYQLLTPQRMTPEVRQWAVAVADAIEFETGERQYTPAVSVDPRAAKLDVENQRLREIIRALTHPDAPIAARLELTMGTRRGDGDDRTLTTHLCVTCPQGNEEALTRSCLNAMRTLLNVAGIDLDVGPACDAVTGEPVATKGAGE